MANLYVRSTDGNNGDNGSTWALAKSNGDGAEAIFAGGDTIWFSQAHAESASGGSNIAWVFNSTFPAVNYLVCGNDAAEPPTALATTATVTTTGNTDISLNGNFYCYGITFSCGAGGDGVLQIGNSGGGSMVYESCNFYDDNSTTGRNIFLNSANAGGYLKFINCGVRFTHTGQFLSSVGGVFHWQGGSLVLSGGATPNVVFGSYQNSSARVLVEDVDFSAAANTIDMTVGVAQNLDFVMRNCKMPSGWASSNLLNSAISKPGTRVSMYNCTNGATNYTLRVEQYAGTIVHETTIVRTGGASDGTTPLSWNMTSNANPKAFFDALKSDEIVVWNDTSGASKTVTVEILHDSVTALTDAEVWLEVFYLGTSGQPQGVLASDRVASFVASAANQTSSAATWTTTGLTNPNTQKLECTFTPQHKGPFYCRVVLAKASKTIYVDPVATVS